MEIKDYLKILQKNLALFVGVILIVLSVTYVYSVRTRPTYHTTSSILLNRKSTYDPAAPFYQYDSYYAIQSSAILANTVESWLQSPATVLEIYQRAEIAPPTSNLQKLGKIFKIRKQLAETNIIDLSIADKNKEKSEKLMKEALAVISEKINQIAQSSGAEGSFEASPSKPITVEIRPNLAINLPIAAIAGIILGLILVFSKDYLGKSK